MAETETPETEAPVEPILAPNLVGSSLGDARRVAKKRAGAKLDIKLVESDAPTHTVIRQRPPFGEEVDGTIQVDVAAKSWVGFLPGIYQDADEENADFLRRYLLIAQHLREGVEERLNFLHEYFDPRLTPEGFLPWLASWLALGLQEGWDEDRRREIVRRAPDLYKKRGTAEGLVLYLRLFADTKAEILEFTWPYPGFVIGKTSTVSVDTTLTYPVFITQCFVVKLADAVDDVPRERLRTIHSVVEAEKPAHAFYALQFAKAEEKFEAVEFLRIAKTGQGIKVNSRIGGRTDMPAIDED